MNVFDIFLSNAKNSTSYENFRIIFLKYLSECRKSNNLFDDFECLCDLIYDVEVNQEWLFRCYCEIFANYEHVKPDSERSFRFLLYIYAVERLVNSAMVDIHSYDIENVEDAEKILGFFFSFIQVRSCWWMFAHVFMHRDENDDHEKLFFKFFRRVYHRPELFISAENVLDFRGHSFCSINQEADEF